MDSRHNAKERLAELDVENHRTEKSGIPAGGSAGKEIERIDAIALAHGTTLASFSHLDEAKILRKMDIRLIPVLAILYLLSFLDRRLFISRVHGGQVNRSRWKHWKCKDRRPSGRLEDVKQSIQRQSVFRKQNFET